MNTDFPTLLDVALSLIYIFFIVSMFVSGIWEFLTTVIHDKRSTLLRSSLEAMFDDAIFVEKLYEHPLVSGQIRCREPRALEKLLKGWGLLVRQYNSDKQVLGLPSYIAPDIFARFVLSLLPDVSPPPGTPDTPAVRLGLSIEALKTAPFDPDPKSKAHAELARLLASLAIDASGVTALKTNLERWYIDYMDRVSGYFKQYAQENIRYVALGVVVVLNLDAVHLTQRLFKDPVLRGTLVESAQAAVRQNGDSLKISDARRHVVENRIRETFRRDSIQTIKATGTAQKSRLDSLLKIRADALRTARKQATNAQDSLQAERAYLFAQRAELAKLPLGWQRFWEDMQPLSGWSLGQYILTTVLGWLLMAAAASFGAPFWFDLLVKLVNIRNVGKKPEPSAER